MNYKRRSIFALTAATMAVGAAPAAAETVYGVTGEATPRLVTFDSASPGNIRTSVAIGGIAPGETIAGIDVRPATNRLMLLDSAGQLYVVDERTGAATTVGGPQAAVAGALGIDFNPTVDRLRVVGQAGQAQPPNANPPFASNGNARLNPNSNGLGGVDGNLAFAAGDPNAGDEPAVPATAYTNSAPASAYFPSPPTTAQFDLEAGNDVLVRQNPPNDGTLATIGPLGVDLTVGGASGFDIVTDADGTTNRAYASIGPAAAPVFYDVDLQTGAATNPRPFPADTPVVDIAVAPTPPLLVALRDVGLGGGQQLAFFSANRPQDVGETVVPITSLPAGVTITNIDQRPANGALFGLGSDGRLYTIALPTGQASAIATITPAPEGSAFGFDFNPTVDRIRIISDTGQNLRVNPDTGAAIVDGALNEGGAPATGFTASGYTNSVRGATATTLFNLNSATDRLTIQNPPNDGTQVAVGPLNAMGTGGAVAPAISPEDGYDIAPRFNHGFATGDGPLGTTSLLAVNVASTAGMPLPPANGGAVVVGALGGAATVRGLAVFDVGAVIPTPANPGTPPPAPPATPPVVAPPVSPGTPAAPARARSRFSYTVRPRRDRRAPFTYTIRGRIVPLSATPAVGAFEGGRVTVRAKRAGTTQTIVTRRVRVSSTGRFTIRVTVPQRALRRNRSGVVRLNLQFNGTRAVSPSRGFARARYR